MSNQVIYTFLIIFIPIFISRFMLEKALNKLDAETKVKLLDAFANQRKYSGLVMLPIMVVYFLLLKMFPQYAILMVGIFGIAFVIYFVLSKIFGYKKLVAINAPEDYLKTYKQATFIVALGFVCVGVQIFLEYYS